ncbi:hypothetical protein BGW80DRAFT_1425856 [Lactifluus volemus]|nr:hypothetical protein BGW80DRAFT_1425856 [Lactifluus volemus]
MWQGLCVCGTCKPEKRGWLDRFTLYVFCLLWTYLNRMPSQSAAQLTNCGEWLVR